MPANTFVPTAEAVARAGMRPFRVDVDSDTLLTGTNKVGRAVGPRTQAIVPVHLFGQTAPVEALVPPTPLSHDIAVSPRTAPSSGSCTGSWASTCGSPPYGR
ncbi:hypothetical protein J2W20_001179 [Sinomonas atrocyanea]|nr:hypothetical protein [Sinomonas atrocyanea]MDR6621305.1 hypothetical protein [Sinomonas atrocyanea]